MPIQNEFSLLGRSIHLAYFFSPFQQLRESHYSRIFARALHSIIIILPHHSLLCIRARKWRGPAIFPYCPCMVWLFLPQSSWAHRVLALTCGPSPPTAPTWMPVCIFTSWFFFILFSKRFFPSHTNIGTDRAVYVYFSNLYKIKRGWLLFSLSLFRAGTEPPPRVEGFFSPVLFYRWSCFASKRSSILSFFLRRRWRPASVRPTQMTRWVELVHFVNKMSNLIKR